MKKLYNQPQTNALAVGLLGAICIGSVHGENNPLQFGGGSTGTDPDEIPM